MKKTIFPTRLQYFFAQVELSLDNVSEHFYITNKKDNKQDKQLVYFV